MSGMTTVAPRETLSELVERLAPHGMGKTAAREALLSANPHLASQSGAAEQRALPEGYLVLVPFTTKGANVRVTSDDAFARAAGLVRRLSALEKALAKKPFGVATALGMATAAKPSDAAARTLQKALAALPEATRALR
ncbi:MAG TPA: hypothetical protein VLJ38_09640 [Polyangiaceae bacterium]|nr:hypothetical protein [Polyangiaceae bacterium]